MPRNLLFEAFRSLPARFVKLLTDEMYDIDPKLGIGNDYRNMSNVIETTN